jgi:hypothetical protein
MNFIKIYPNADQNLLNQFSLATKDIILNSDQLWMIFSKDREDSVMLKILKRIKQSPKILAKHSEERSAFWTCLLLKLMEFEDSLLIHMKYPTVRNFQTAYEGKLIEEKSIDKTELYHLWRTANWTHLFLNLMLVAKKMKKVPKKKFPQPPELSEVARASKGLVLHAIPKVIEGFDGYSRNPFILTIRF